MKTITVLSQKGGTGKTTLVLHLAVAAAAARLPVAVLDLDPQASATAWRDSRRDSDPPVTAIEAGALAAALEAAAAGGTVLTIIDTAPHSSEAASAAAAAADLILIPCRPGILDLRAIATTARIAQLAQKPAFVVLSQAPPHASRIVEDASQAVGQHGLAVVPVVLHQRAAYAHALTAGQTAGEYEPGGKADGEVRRLLAWVRGALGV